ncbi:cobalamin biosynthesis protein [Nitratireductor sp. ZSWI3]|uniref:cobalamin biosynthesis protein n=1 Tax=Nitratireductor sp. ZSWI3 TaxID=2966359 RepID=UPI002150029D|nr:cobalamin biosynthesis protein [Nitratireductor sp. ZSWI3]MCR4269436.1 cobalamin biosynthesis protein [Nitratireductor sp. ZSWI3]
MICAGLGSRSGVKAEVVVEAVDAALAHHGLGRDALDALATVARKNNEMGLREAASRLGLPLIVATPDALRQAEPRCLTTSRASLAATRTSSASEAAALAACGEHGRLLGPRLAHHGVTCAIAKTGSPS